MKKLFSPGTLRRETLNKAAQYLAESRDTALLLSFFSLFMKYKAAVIKKEEIDRANIYDKIMREMVTEEKK